VFTNTNTSPFNITLGGGGKNFLSDSAGGAGGGGNGTDICGGGGGQTTISINNQILLIASGGGGSSLQKGGNGYDFSGPKILPDQSGYYYNGQDGGSIANTGGKGGSNIGGNGGGVGATNGSMNTGGNGTSRFYGGGGGGGSGFYGGGGGGATLGFTTYGGGGGGSSVVYTNIPGITFINSVNAFTGVAPNTGGGAIITPIPSMRIIDSNPIQPKAITDNGNGVDGTVTISWSIPATSNICFPAGTPIKTDQGIIPIEYINKLEHTIGSQAIKYITQTITLDKYLICFPANSVRLNVPNKMTVMSKDHKIEYKGQLVSADKFLDFCEEVKKVKYSGEILYNVLLENHSTMNVNNLICETLHPDNIIAKLYTSNFSQSYKNDLIGNMNDALNRKDKNAYNSIVSYLTTF
jgi:hypothetical protein